MKPVKVRLSGDTAALGAALALLVSAAQIGGAEIAEQSALYPNRRDPGFRLYVTLRFPTADGDASPTSAGRRTAAKQSAAPLPPVPAKETQERTRLP